jgi:hypothetical protein
VGEHRGLLLQSAARSVKERAGIGRFEHAAHLYGRNTVVRQEVTCYDHQLTGLRRAVLRPSDAGKAQRHSRSQPPSVH